MFKRVFVKRKRKKTFQQHEEAHGEARREAHEKVCLEDPWMHRTRVNRYLRIFEACFSMYPELRDSYATNSTSIDCIITQLATRSNGYGTKRHLKQLWYRGDGKARYRHNIALALLFLLKYEDSDSIHALVENIGDRVHRCDSAQKQAYILTIQQAAEAFERSGNNEDGPKSFVATPWDRFIPTLQEIQHATGQGVKRRRKGANEKGSHDSDSYDIQSQALQDIQNDIKDSPKREEMEEALQKIHFMVEDYLDTHKLNAFKSALQEPARFYFNLCHNQHHVDHVNVHGLNGYLCIIRGWFGCEIPIIPQDDDIDTFKGCGDHWAGLNDQAWEVFCDKENFGKDFEGIKALNRSMLKDRKYGGYDDGHAFVRGLGVGMERAASKKSKKFLSYANKFAHFFQKDFLITRMFEVLNAEGKPEYVGFQKACETLYPLFRQYLPAGSNNGNEHFLHSLYDEDLMHLDVEKAAILFWWLGVCKELSLNEKPVPTAEAGVSVSTMVVGGVCQPEPDELLKTFVVIDDSDAINDSDNVDDGDDDDEIESEKMCPICFEEKDNITPIPHWDNPKGDISGHKMCLDCAHDYKKNFCPFCNEVCLKDNILACIDNLISQLRDSSAGGDPNDLAAIMETWQFFEMEYGDNPKVIYRVAQLVIQDERFNQLLRHGVLHSSSWMRDAAGIIFRLYSLSEEGNLVITTEETKLLQDCYNTILRLITAVDIEGQGHYYGAIYTQAMVPYICALQTGQNTDQLQRIVKEVGTAMVAQYKKKRRHYPVLRSSIRERIVSRYMDIATVNVWGGKRHDPVRKAFY